MAVLPLKTAPKCKLCQSPRRADMDALLEMRSLRKKDAAGNDVNFDYVAARYSEWHDGGKLTKENVSGHWKNHCELVEADVVDSLQAAERRLGNAALEAIERILGPDRHTRTPTVDEMLELRRALYALELETRALAGIPLGLTHDHASKDFDSSTKRKRNEEMAGALELLGAGIGRALLGGGSAKPALPASAGEVVIPESEVEEAEVAGG